MAQRSKSGGHDVPGLKRRKHRREPKRRFILFCEGEKTEPAYFEAIYRACSSTLIKVKPYPGAGVPYTIAEKAVAFAESEGLAQHSRRSKESFEEHDQVWAVFDRDDHPRFDEAVALCEKHGVGVGRSNPCFELWLILHEREYNQPNHRRKVQAELKALRPEYDARGAKTPNCDELATRVQDAEKRGEALLRNRDMDGCPYGNPSTTVGRLTRAIREANEQARP